MISEFFTSNPSQTRQAGKLLAKEVLKTKPGKRAFVFGLRGDLGGGKTTFLQGFARGLGIRQKILSPTFVIMRKFNNFYHLDCYRLKKPQEIVDLGFKKIIAGPENIVAVEWADRVRKIMPKNTIWINLEFIDDKKRKIVIK